MISDDMLLVAISTVERGLQQEWAASRGSERSARQLLARVELLTLDRDSVLVSRNGLIVSIRRRTPLTNKEKSELAWREMRGLI